MKNETEQILTPGDNLVLEGVPAIPKSLAERAGRYTEFRQALFFDWHPIQREMLISTRFGNTAQVHQVSFPGGDRRQITFFPDAVRGASYQPTHGDYFVFNLDTGGSEFAQNYRFDRATREITFLTDGQSKNSLGIWSHRGNQMAYTSTRRTGKDVDIYVIDPTDTSSDHLVLEGSGGGWFASDWSPDDKMLLVTEYVSVNESYLWLADTMTGEKTLLTPKGDAQVSYSGAQFSSDGNFLYATTDCASEFRQLATIHLFTSEQKILTGHIAWDVERFDLSRDGRRIAFVTNEDGLTALRLLDTATGLEQPIPKIPAGLLGSIQWHQDSRHLAFELVAARSPTDVYSLDADTGKTERWTESETGGLNTEGFADPELIRWPSFDNRAISGFLYRPPAKFTGKRPVMIVIHGGPESQFRPVYLGRNNYYLNELGVALLYPNVRGSSGYGKTFLTLDNGYLREDSYKDIESLLDWIAAQPDLDSARILVSGGSYGGHMTLAVATRYNDRIRCALDIVGMSNLVTFLENTEGYRQDLRRVEYGDERDPEMRAFLESIAPLHHAANITKPLFVLQGKNDPRVPFTEALQMVETVRKNNAPVWFLMANDEGHGFAKKTNLDFQFYATILFIQRFLVDG